MDGKRLRLSLHSPVLSPLNKPIVPVRVSSQTSCQMKSTAPHCRSHCVSVSHAPTWHYPSWKKSSFSYMISTFSFQNTEKSKDWYKSMFKQIHRIPGERSLHDYTLPHLCVWSNLACCVPVPLCLFFSVFVCMWSHTVFCLSITVLRSYWGKPLPPHLHFPWELWYSHETKRYLLAVTAGLSLALLICWTSRAFSNTFTLSDLIRSAKTLKVFERIWANLCF